MNGSLDQFKATLRRRQERTRKQNPRAGRPQEYKDVSAKPKYNFGKFSHEEFKVFKAKLQKRRKINSLLFYIFIVVVLIVVFFFLYKNNLL